MVSISYDVNKDLVTFKFGGDNFRELLDFCKRNHFGFDKDTKLWSASIDKYTKIVDEARALAEPVDSDMLVQTKFNTWKRSLCQLRRAPSRRAYHQELLNFPPLKGIPPNENFQYQDFMRALHQNRFLFNHEMGLGKSWDLAALIEHLRYYKEIDKSLVFSSSIGVRNLKNELLKFCKTITADDIIEFNSASSIPFEDRDIFNSEKYPQKIIILPYDFLKSVSNYYYDKEKATKRCPHPSSKVNYRGNFMPIKEWLGGNTGGLFLDECHNLGRKSRRTDIMDRIIPFFEYRYEFTGTLADVYEKLWKPLQILDPALVKGLSYDDWCAEYNEVGNKYSDTAINPDKWNLPKLGELNKQLMDNYGAKRKMVECLDLPPNIEVPVKYIPMSSLQRKIYERFVNFTMDDAQKLAQSQGKTLTEKVVNMFAYIQESVDNPTCLLRSPKFDLFPVDLQNDIKKFDCKKDNSKLDIVDEIVEENTGELGHKGILWYFHPETEKALTEKYKKYNPYVINADTKREDRIPLVNKFLSDPKSKLIIASINILNTSVTMIECKYEVYVEKTYKYVDYKQSRGRIFRPGQDEITRTYSIRFSDSIDNLQEMNLNTKGETLNSLMNKEYLTHDLWKKLFNLQNANSTIF